MKITVKVGIVTAIVWMICKITPFALGYDLQTIAPFVLLNILGVLVSISLGLFLHKRSDNGESNLLTDVKNAMSAGVPYAFLVSLFIYFYYENINPEFNRHQIAEYETALLKDLNNPVEFQKIKDSNPDYEVKTKEEIHQSIMQGPKSFFKASSTMAMSLLSMLMLATLYSILVAVIYRKFIFR